MPKKPAKALFFNDGFVFDKNHIFIASQFQEYSGSDLSRVTSIVDNKWSYTDFDDAALSVTCLPERLALFMGHNGNILVIGQGRQEVEVIPDVKKYGTLLRIRSIGSSAYVCGMTGQVLVRHHNDWTHIDTGLLGKDGLDFEDIGGTGPNNLYLVGIKGAIFHYDGRRWQSIESPTNRPLSGVKVVSKDEVYICGDDGNLFKGNGRKWKSIGLDEPDRDFWSVEAYRDKIYVAYDGGLMCYDGDELEEVEFKLKGDIDCHRLHANDGVMWSFGLDTLLYTDGRQWYRVDCPANL